MGTSSKVSRFGVDVHGKFSVATARDASGQVLSRHRLDHTDREALRQTLRQWPSGAPVILEASFGWGWMCDELMAAGLQPHLASSVKVAAWRKAWGLAKSNRIDADLLAELWDQQPRWWEVWLAPQEVRDQRELLRHRMGLVATQTQVKNRIHARWPTRSWRRSARSSGLPMPASWCVTACWRRWLTTRAKRVRASRSGDA